MPVNKDVYSRIMEELLARQVRLVAVSKTKSVSEIRQLYDLGQRDFGENYVQELTEKQVQLPSDIRWHFIGHLQSNKVKYIAPFVHLVQSVDSVNLLTEISKHAVKLGREISCLLQVHIAQEETKFGFDEEDLFQIYKNGYSRVKICGLMGMASLSSDENKVRNEFKNLKSIYDHLSATGSSMNRLTLLSMGMSGDYRIAVKEGSNMVRIGSLLFGERIYKK
jgi:pyridoxal phosphate enzyme (YggS family)